MASLKTTIIWLLVRLYLKYWKQFPEFIQVAKVGSHFVVSADSAFRTGGFITPSTSTGMSSLFGIARLKCTSEWIERIIVKKLRNKHPKRFEFGSDGCAAYPIIPGYKEKGRLQTRKNAIAESIERFVWLKWWRHLGSKHDLKLSASARNFFFNEFQSCLNGLEIEDIHFILPHFESKDFENYEVIVGYVKLRGMGFISGAACGLGKERKDSMSRATSEIKRHLMAFERMTNIPDYKPISFYEKRLLYFGTGKGNHLVLRRLSSRELNPVKLPNSSLYELEMYGYHFSHHKFESHSKFISDNLELCL